MKRKSFPIENSLYVFFSFAAIGGFLEAYTFLLHGGVFCNAQTGNLVLFVMRLCEGQFSASLHYLWSILAYMAGIGVSVLLPRVCRKTSFLIAVTAAEAAVLAGLAFQPEGTPDQITYVSVAFLCALQYNSFTSCRGATLATTFCTNNLRQTVIHLCGGISEKDREKLRKSGIYACVIAVFAVGAAAGVLTAKALGNISILLCALLLLPVIAVLAVTAHRRKKTEGNLSAAETGPAQSQPSQNADGQVPADLSGQADREKAESKQSDLCAPKSSTAEKEPQD